MVSNGNENQTNQTGALITCTESVTNGKPRLGSRIPAACDLYQPLPAAGIKYTLMKHPLVKTLLLATVMILGATVLHYLMGSMSY